MPAGTGLIATTSQSSRKDFFCPNSLTSELLEAGAASSSFVCVLKHSLFATPRKFVDPTAAPKRATTFAKRVPRGHNCSIKLQHLVRTTPLGSC